MLAAAILAELGDIRRFKNEREFSNCIGFAPGIYQSSETVNKIGLTPRCKALLRSYLIESAWLAIRTDPEIQTYYRKHVGKSFKNVVVNIICNQDRNTVPNKLQKYKKIKHQFL